MFTIPLTGAAWATRATSAATSAPAIGWIRPSGTRTSPSTMSDAVIASANSWNWVARTMVWGSPDSVMMRSWATLARM